MPDLSFPSWPFGSNSGGTTPVNISPNYPPATNTAALQAALDGGGHVLASTPGVIEMNALTIGDNTHLEIGPLTTLRLADNQDINPICNKAYDTFNIDGTKPSISSLTSSGMIVTAVTAAAHTLAVGDYVSISGSTTRGYGGCFEVQTVADNTHFTYRAAIFPGNATSAGTITFCKANRNIRIDGGGWIDCNRDGNGGASGQIAGCGIVLGHVFDYVVSDINMTECSTRGVFTFNALNAVVEDFYGDQMQVMVQTNGAMKDFWVRRITVGMTTDDVVAIMNKEASGFPAQAVSEGDMIGIHVDGISGGGFYDGVNEPSRPLAVYSCSTTYYYEVEVKNITGSRINQTSTTSITVEGDVGGTTAGSIDHISIENCEHTCTQLFSTQYAQIGTLILKNIEVMTITGQLVSQWINILATSYVLRLFVDDLRCTKVTAPGVFGYVILHAPHASTATEEVVVSNSKLGIGTCALFAQSGNIIDSLRFENCESISGQMFFQASGTIYTANYNNIRCSAGSVHFTYNGAVRTTNVNTALVRDAVSLISFAGANTYNVNYTAVDSSIGPTTSICYVNNASAIVNCDVQGGNLGSGTTLAFPANGTVHPKSFGVLADPTSARISPAQGNRCYSTRAGTSGGPAIAVDGTNWYALATGVGGINTLVV